MATHPESSSQPRVPLSRERVLSAAIRLADEGGIESLTMRKLAQALGVEAMSLYNHVANKGEIVDGIVDRVVSEIELPAGADNWDTAIRRCAISAHDVLLRHPWACSLVMSPARSPAALSARMRYIEWLLGRLREAGFPPELAYHAYHALDSHILGFTLWQLGHSAGTDDMADFAATFLGELPAGEFPYLAEHIRQHLAPSSNGDSEFEFGLDLILDGLERARVGAGGFEPP
jgi:AcrR family transcriptional regulator